MSKDPSRDDELRAVVGAAALAAQIIEDLREESRAAAEVADEAARVAALEIGNLRLAMQGRLVIGQAQGVLMANLDIDADRAFAFMIRVSSITNVKLRDVAAEIARTRRVPRPPEPSA